MIQSSFHCCGVNNFTDWLLLPSLTVPGSCLKNVTHLPDSEEQSRAEDRLFFTNLPDSEEQIQEEDRLFFSDGCYKIVKNKLDTDILIINGTKPTLKN